MRETVNMLIRQKEKFNKCFSFFISNKEISLEERWEVYCLACEAGIYAKNCLCCVDLETLESHSRFSTYYDDFYIQRYTTVHFYELVRRVEENMARWPGLNLNDLKEEVLSNEYTSYLFDW